MLTRLPEVLSVLVLSTWLDLMTVAKASSALCNKKNRSGYLNLLRDPTFASSDSTYHSSKEFWRWIVANGIKLQFVKGLGMEEFGSEVDCSKAVEFHVERLKLVPQVAWLINKSIHLKTLVVCYEDCTTATLSKLLSLITDQIWSGLNGLTIGASNRIHNIDYSNDLSSVSVACTQLRSFSVFIRCCGGASENTLIQIIKNNKKLRKIELYMCVCKTAFMTAIGLNCVELQSLAFSCIDVNDCSIESMCEMLTRCKQLTFVTFGVAFRLTTSNNSRLLLTISILMFDLVPTVWPILDLHGSKLGEVKLWCCDDENLLVQISLKCPQLTELCVSVHKHSWSVDTLRSIVSRCTKLQMLTLCYVDATYDEMVSIFCSDQVLALTRLVVFTTTPHPGLDPFIQKHNPSLEYCKTIE